MEKGIIEKLNKRFEEYAYEQDGTEYWLARELQELLGYSDWRNFLNTVNKAKESCKTTGEEVSNHFVDVNKMVKIGSGAERNQEDIMHVTLSLKMEIQKRNKLLLLKVILPFKHANKSCWRNVFS
jgi:hypothetical protein